MREIKWDNVDCGLKRAMSCVIADQTIKESYNRHITRQGHKDQDSNSFSNSHHLHMLVMGFENYLSYVTQMHILTNKGLRCTYNACM